MSLRQDTLEALRIHGIKPRINLGQSFVVDQGLIDRMVNYAKICDEDDVLDIGAGLGFLTEALAKKAKHVYAVEIDPRLLKVLRKRLAPYQNVSIIQGDLRKVRLPTIDKVVSNPPYSISSDLFLRRLLDYRLSVLTLQREFVEKLMAQPGSPKYGRISVMAGLLWKIERLETLPRGAFQPIPKVQSCLIRLTKVQGSEDIVPIVKDTRFLDLLSFLFSERRRNLGKVLKKYLELRGIPKKVEDIEASRHALSLRVCDLEPMDFVAIARALIALKNRK
ncbi:ribosomal RNA small subunit methyltransferase A [Candidatus Bathyarchaeota archaeon]|nr:ribosomal RNA small subunit methyltransferase A [Candidatus Bathyarchaeota archaeon]MBS7628161.1 ribosomal RNA small subunit methyltransferase A [Candidatus Bathyarchaeota archaeon]